MLTNVIFSSPIPWEFPKAHGIHPTFDTEWYYITGHLIDENNTRHGFQVTFFRHKLSAIKDSKSPWNSPHLYTAHFAFTDGEDKTFQHYEAMGRNSYGIAGGQSDSMGVFIRDWSLKMIDDVIHIDIKTENGRFKLNLSSQKPIVFHGKNGYSKKSDVNERFSYYYSYTRLVGTGSYQQESKSLKFQSASAWMDREIFNSLLDKEQIGWDWFAIQLANGEEIMAFQVRSDTKAPYYSGTYISESGASKPLSKDDFTLTPLEFWTSPKSNITYPIKWQLKLLKRNQNFIISARFNHQELQNTIPFPFYYWEGQCDVTGTHSGQAYMELVGY